MMNGFGKTAVVLIGAVAATEETGCRVVYACRATRQILKVIEEAARLQKRQSMSGASLLSNFD